jgi:hypothetical protein
MAPFNLAQAIAQAAPAPQTTAVAPSPTTAPTPFAPTAPARIPAGTGPASGFPAFTTPRPAGIPTTQAPSAIDRAAMLAAARPKELGNRLVPGTGLYLIKDGKYKVTEKGVKLTSFSLFCIKGITDGQGLAPGASLYTGPRAGETYENAVFHEGKFPQKVLEQYKRILAATHGWTLPQVYEIEATPEGRAWVADAIKGIFGCDLYFAPTNVPSSLSNQVIMEIKFESKMVDKKVDKQVVFDGQGRPLQVKAENAYWNRRVFFDDPQLAEFVQNQDAIVKAFGSIEAATAAANNEKQFRAAMGC